MGFDPLSGRVIEAAIAVHKELGPGFLELIYENAMAICLKEMGIRYVRQRPIEVRFHGELVGTHVLDMTAEDQIVVELKAVKGFEDIHFAQVRSYLKASGLTVGLLLNFNAPTVQIKRIVLGYED